MSAASIVIVSKDKDFSAVLAEHAAAELAAHVQVVDSVDTAKSLTPHLIVSCEPLAEALSIPLLVVNDKPVVLQTLLALMRDSLAQDERAIGDAVFSLRHKTVRRGEDTVLLTDKEARLLALLLAAKGQGVAKDALLKEVWDVDRELESHTLETHVYRLRAKLKEAGIAATLIADNGKYRLSL